MATTLFADPLTWTGAAADNSFWTAGNWTNAQYPTGTNPNSSVTYMNTPGVNINMSAGGYIGAIHISANTASGSAPVLNLNLGAAGNLNLQYENLYVGGEMNHGGGVINQTGGYVADQYWINFNVGGADSTYTNCSGTYNFGGTASYPAYIVGQGASNGSTFGGSYFSTFNVGAFPTDTGVLNLHGYGTFATCGQMLGGTVAYTWGKGGTLNVGTSGTGTMSITGGNLSIVVGHFNLGLTAGIGILKETIDTTGISTINVTQSVSFGNNAQFNLSLGSGFTATNGQVFTVITDTGGAGNWTGTFYNLKNGGIITSNGYVFQAAYGDTGMSLTVIGTP